MKNFFLLLFCLVFINNYLYSQAVTLTVNRDDGNPNNLDYSKLFKVVPEKPIPGQDIKIYFTSTGTSLEKADSIYATLLFYTDKIDTLKSFPMKKNGDTWETDVNTGKETGIIGVKFENDQSEVTNLTNGYFIPMYDNDGKLTTKAVLGSFAARIDWGKYIGLGYKKEDNTKDIKTIEKILSDNPELKPKYINVYLRTALRNKDKIDVSFVENILKDYKENYASTEDDYINMIYGYTFIKNADKIKELTAEAVGKFTGGYFAINEELKKISPEKGFSKRFDMLETLLKKFPDNMYVTRYMENIVHFLTKENDVSNTQDFYNRFKHYLVPGLYTTIINWILNNNVTDLEQLADDLAKYAMDVCEKEYANPTKKRPDYTSDLTWLRQRKASLIWSYIYYANVLWDKKDNELALKYYDKMATVVPIATFVNEEMMSHYTDLLVWAKRDADAEKIIEHAIKTDKMTSEMKASLKTIYLNKYGNEEKYNEYVKTFEGRILDKLKEEYKKKLLKQPAPDFTLTDLNGKTVSLSDYKGKVVVLDFWATWCGPCMASMPGMQKSVTKFASDNDVVFLFINTSEQTPDVDKKIQKWLLTKNYTFDVCLDKDYKVRDLYNARSIPHKFFVDKSGKIRIERVGYSGSPDHLVDEISAIISLLKES